MALTYNFELSVSSVKQLQSQLENYSKKLEDSKIYIHQALADRAYELIMMNCPVDTGELIDSFVIDVSKDMADVYTECEHAKYVEFGTGIRGSESGYPLDIAQTFVEDSWKGYKVEVNGQVAQKFMYNAWLELQKEGSEIVRKVLIERGLL